MGTRSRYRLIDLERLCWRLRAGSLDEVRKNLEARLIQTIAGDRMKREACWTESLAVGSNSFVEQIQPLILSRMEAEIVEADEDVWILKETPIPYGQKTGPKNGCKALN